MLHFKYCQCTLNILYLILTITVVVECIKNENQTVGTIQNLSVSILQDDAFNNSRIFKFNISWLPPPSGRTPTSYSVLVSSVSNEERKNKSSCPKESLYYTTQNENEFQVLLPKRKFLTEISEFNIHLRCSYKIQVFANPRTNSLQTASKIFTVPDCVGSTCSCQESKQNFSALEIRAEFLSSGDILIKWKLNSNDSRIYFYSISIGFPLLLSKNGFPVFKKTKITKLTSENFSFLWKREKVNNYNITNESLIFVTAEDNRGCPGNEKNSSIEFLKQGTTKANIIFPLLGIIFVIVLFISLFTILCLRSRKAYNAILFDKKLPRSRRIDLILRNHNILYLDQENDITCKNYEINFNEIEIKRELGRGQFGRVYLASLQSQKTSVAVKVSSSDPIHEEEARKQLLEEIETIKAAGPHPHLVGLVGFCISVKNPICLILEYMEGGDLLSYLYSLRDKKNSFEIKYSNISNQRPIINETILDFGKTQFYTEASRNLLNSDKFTNILVDKHNKNGIKYENKFVERNQFLCFALQIALGMEHLENKMIIHRDLAARNILIDSNFNLKISDFGLSRNGIYVMGNGMGCVRRLPIRWMSPEALRERAFSSKSDVWSFSVVLWEIGTLGMFPYSNVQDDDLLKYILSDDNSRLPKPENIECDIYNIMSMCWASKPEQRPSFKNLVSVFSFLTQHTCTSDNFGKTNPCYSLLSSS